MNAIIHDRAYSYEELYQEVASIKQRNIIKNEVVAIVGDYNFNSIAHFLALKDDNIIVPIVRSPLTAEKIKIARCTRVIDMDAKTWVFNKEDRHDLYAQVKSGLVLFSSGSTGQPKAMLLDLDKIALQHEHAKKSFTSIIFLMFDHIGGINTLFYMLNSKSCMIIPQVRTPEAVAALIEQHQADLLPASPTFLNLMLLKNVFDDYNLNSLKLITYGTEPMPQIVLDRVVDKLPNVKFKQTYGLSELGILSTQSKDNQSLWMKIGGDGFHHKILDGELWLQSKLAMVGYLNADNPFVDGWYPTGDMVEQDGDYIKIIGRKTEVINVGGQKVLPTEVENVIQQIEGIRAVVVKGERNFIVGQMVVAIIDGDVDKQTIKNFCRERLEDYKVPVKIYYQTNLINERYKKRRQV